MNRPCRLIDVVTVEFDTVGRIHRDEVAGPHLRRVFLARADEKAARVVGDRIADVVRDALVDVQASGPTKSRSQIDANLLARLVRERRAVSVNDKGSASVCLTERHSATAEEQRHEVERSMAQRSNSKPNPGASLASM